MHPETVAFLEECTGAHGDEFSGNVFEFGSYDINGSVRDEIGYRRNGAIYTGVDWREGPGVDSVGIFHENWSHEATEPYDVFVSTNTFEHDPYWRKSLAKAARMLRFNGLVCLSVPMPGFGKHELISSPEKDYYGEPSPDDFAAELLKCGFVGKLTSGIGQRDLEMTYVGRNEAPIARQYHEALRRSDINEHLPTLWRLASQSRSVVEFGVRTGASTAALVAGCPLVTSYDISAPPRSRRMEVLGDCGWTFNEMSSLDATPTATDFLFIDSLHNGEQLEAELHRHGRGAELIAMHDTVTFGKRGESSERGLWLVILEFCEAAGYSIKEHHENNNGLTVIGRSG